MKGINPNIPTGNQLSPVVSGALKDCFRRVGNSANYGKFLASFWDLDKSEQDSFEARLQLHVFHINLDPFCGVFFAIGHRA